jgi:integrase
VATIPSLQAYRLGLEASEARALACGSAPSVRDPPLVLSPKQVKLGLAELEFRDQLLVFLEGALGIRQGELGALRWLECDFENMSFSVQRSYYWRRGGNLKSTKTEASAKLLPMHPSLRNSLQEWRSQSLYNKPEDFVFPSERLRGSKPLDLASVLKNKIQPAFRTDRYHACGLAHVSAFGWNHAGGDGRTSAHNPRLLAAQQPSCHEQVPAGNIEDQTLGTGQIGRRYFADGYFAEDKPNPMSAVEPFSDGTILVRRLSSPNIP